MVCGQLQMISALLRMRWLTQAHWQLKHNWIYTNQMSHRPTGFQQYTNVTILNVDRQVQWLHKGGSRLVGGGHGPPGIIRPHPLKIKWKNFNMKKNTIFYIPLPWGHRLAVLAPLGSSLYISSSYATGQVNSLQKCLTVGWVLTLSFQIMFYSIYAN